MLWRGLIACPVHSFAVVPGLEGEEVGDGGFLVFLELTRFFGNFVQSRNKNKNRH